MEEYSIEIKTNKNMGEYSFIHNLLYSWCEHKEVGMRPERFGSGEPIRHSIQQKGVDNVVNMWHQNQMPVLLKRVSNPKFSVDMSWRPEKGLDTREYPWNCSIWLHKKAGDNFAKMFLEFLIEHFNPAYGFISTYEHEKNKHFIKYKSKKYIGATEEKFVGNEITKTFPSIYWLTYFNNDMVKRIGKKKFDTLNIGKILFYKHGIMIQSYDKCFDQNTYIENKIIEHLGKEIFFDKFNYIEKNNLELV